MSKDQPTHEEIVTAIRAAADRLGHAPSRAEFRAATGVTEYWILGVFASWRDAVRAAGFEPDSSNIKLTDDELWSDWASLVRQRRHIPTRSMYRRDGRYSAAVYEKHFGPWSGLPDKFRQFAADKAEWQDVVALLPLRSGHSATRPIMVPPTDPVRAEPQSPTARHPRLDDRPTYGDPIDFRGLRHEPVNEQGVVFLFGMVARELGYMVEAVQTGYPDCEAKRQVGAGKWQRVRIEFEFESRNFRDHGHAAEGCDLIVCWRHNWSDCPEHLEVVELRSVIPSLASDEE